MKSLMRKKTRYWQLAVFVAFILVYLNYDPRSEMLRLVVDSLVVVQAILLWFVFDEFWPRFALGTSLLLLFECLFVKWARPHYFAPAACLILFLQVDALRRIWNWEELTEVTTSRSERRRAARENRRYTFGLSCKQFVVFLPIICAISLVARVAGRAEDWWKNESGPSRHVLLLHDWSLRRAELVKWLESQQSSQLVFVRYSPRHNVNFEWVYNHADIMHSHVIWARDLGSEHNKLLLNLLPDRVVWLLEADAPDAQLVRYSESGPTTKTASVAQTAAPSPDDDQLNW